MGSKRKHLLSPEQWVFFSLVEVDLRGCRGEESWDG